MDYGIDGPSESSRLSVVGRVDIVAAGSLVTSLMLSLVRWEVNKKIQGKGKITPKMVATATDLIFKSQYLTPSSHSARLI